MQKAMQSDAAVFRTQKSLDEGVEKMTDVFRSYDNVGIKGEFGLLSVALAHTLLDSR
jgi:succinate dehydrogenase (ubiquinone) flavoprotein subunit